MKSQYKFNDLEQDTAEAMPLEAQTTVLFEVVKNVLDEGSFKARTIKYKLLMYNIFSLLNICNINN